MIEGSSQESYVRAARQRSTVRCASHRAFVLSLPLSTLLLSGHYTAFRMIPRLLFLLLLTTSLLTVRPVAAQYIGAIKIGGTVTNFSGETNTSTDPRAGLTAGVGLGYDFGNGFLFQPEILYVRKGAYANTFVESISNDMIVQTPVRARFDLTYLEVPLLAVYRFEGRRLEPRLFAGPYGAYKLNARVTFRPLDSDGPSQSDEDDSAESFDYGGIVGAGADFFLSGQRLSIDARAVFGQGNVRQANPPLKLVGSVLMIGILF